MPVIKCKDNGKEASPLEKECPRKLPLLTAMQAYLAEQVVPFHTPGHKLGRGAPESMKLLLGADTLALDLTFIPGLGDLFEQQGPIQDAQKNAARLYGADASYFLINGTTGGIYAMILATVGPGDKIIVPRNVHRSVLGGLILSGAVPVFVQPAIDPELQIAMNVSAAAMESAIMDTPDAKAVLLVNPSYYGVSSDIVRITNFAHDRGLTVLVDEAHGPHLHFSSGMPLSGLDAGADIVVQSTHKLLGALSQASLLHCKGKRVNAPRLETMLQLVQSSSPNYILLASLEAAVSQMAENGTELVEQSMALAQTARKRINRIPGLSCFGEEQLGRPGVYGLDPTKLTVSVRGVNMRGNVAAMWLRSEGKVQAELSDWNNVLFLVTLGDNAETLEHLAAALTKLAVTEKLREALPNGQKYSLPESAVQLMLSPRDAVFSKRERISFPKAAGRICAETVVSYPPGVPLLLPGELIMPEMLEYCQTIKHNGFSILGPEDPALNTIGVVA